MAMAFIGLKYNVMEYMLGTYRYGLVSGQKIKEDLYITFEFIGFLN